MIWEEHQAFILSRRKQAIGMDEEKENKRKKEGKVKKEIETFPYHVV
jgi:hypothetical protein